MREIYNYLIPYDFSSFLGDYGLRPARREMPEKGAGKRNVPKIWA
jgi:hypothetical protein